MGLDYIWMVESGLASRERERERKCATHPPNTLKEFVINSLRKYALALNSGSVMQSCQGRRKFFAVAAVVHFHILASSRGRAQGFRS